MSPAVLRQVRLLMAERRCSFARACSILGRHAAVARAAKKRREENRRRGWAAMERMGLA